MDCLIPNPLIRSLLLSGSLTACGTMGLSTYSPDELDAERPIEGPNPNDSDATDWTSDSNDESNAESDVETEESNNSGAEDNSEPTTEGPVECTYDRFPVAMHQATQDNSVAGQPMFIYQARNTSNSPFDELQILSYQAEPYYGPSEAGDYSLAGSNYADCALCVLVIGDCNDSYQCDQVFFASEGTLQIDRLNDSGGPFRATLVDAVFEEVSIDAATYRSTPVPGGETWCIDEVSIDVSTYLYD